MKANAPKRKIFNDALDVLCGEDIAAPVNGIEMLPIDSVHPFRKHPFRLYEGERLDDMVGEHPGTWDFKSIDCLEEF